MIRYIIILLTFLITSYVGVCQEKYWVFLSDKAHSVDDRSTYLDSRTIDRRIKMGLPKYDSKDLPISNSYFELISQNTVEIKGVSRWFNAICCRANEDQIKKIKSFSFVKDVKRTVKHLNTCRTVSEEISMNNLMERQITSLEGQYFYKNNLTGKGIRICVIDGGFKGTKESPALKHLFENKQVLKSWDFHHKTENVYRYNNHGTAVLSCIAGKYENQIMGLAQSSEFLLARTERVLVENESEEELWLMAMEWADANGADIINTSLGYTSDEYFNYQMDGETSLIARAVNLAAKKGILVLVSAGNSGDDDWKYIATPADADSALTVGAVTGSGLHRDFSSFGPTSDYRMKPNVVAFGDVMGATKNGIEKAYGTSFSCPLVAGFAACVWEKHPNKSNMEIFKLVERSGSLFPYFDYAHGFGVPKASFFFKDEEKNPTFKIRKVKDSVLVEIIDKSYLNTGTQYMFMHVEYDQFNYQKNKRKVLEYYETIYLHKDIPYVINASQYKDRTLRFHLNGYTEKIQL